MLAPLDLGDAQSGSLLGRSSPLVKLGLAIAWLVGLALTLEPGPPLVLAAVALAAGLMLGGIPPVRLARALAPLVLAAASMAVTNLLFAAANTDPASTELARIGPLRLTAEAAEAAAALAARVLAIVSVGAVFVQTTDPTRLVDSLVWQGRLPERFAYGALAAYQAVPRLGEDLATLRGARRIRGLGGSWHPRLLVGLLVRAIRHADQLALAMDARAFGSGPRTTYRPIRRGWPDAVVGIGGLVALALIVLW
ncbi:MAG TPA: energy-coupling factor transporter transmembrane component T [Candidatus Sulfomarinibacteraceae bacterium]|nr:energy-coupling factor transporter transmembrane component T [Candidatus Sulfomarinibacteraceae bacterium]